jgi:hypothetical protein
MVTFQKNPPIRFYRLPLQDLIMDESEGSTILRSSRFAGFLL